MAVGAGVASILMVFFIDVGGWLILLGCGAILLAGLPIFPPVFRSIIKILRMDRLSPKIARAASNLKTRTAVIGWILLPFSWLLVGLSLWATTQLTGIAAVDIDELPRLTACAAMAIVVGFLSMMPGGLGVRELVLIAILAPIDPAFDSATTLIVAVTLRLIWLLTELVLTIILKGLGFVSKRKSLKTKSGISSQPNPTGTSSDT